MQRLPPPPVNPECHQTFRNGHRQLCTTALGDTRTCGADRGEDTPKAEDGNFWPKVGAGWAVCVVAQEHSFPQVCAQSLPGVLESLSLLSSSCSVTNSAAGLLPEHRECDLAQEGFCIAMLYDFTIRHWLQVAHLWKLKAETSVR